MSRNKMKILYSNHSVKQMFSRNITTDEVEYSFLNCEIVMDYPDDKPYPSKLILAFCNNRPIHLVYSYNAQEETYVIITVYEPSTDIWEKDFKTRKK